MSHHYQLNNRVFAFFAQFPFAKLYMLGVGLREAVKKGRGGEKDCYAVLQTLRRVYIILFAFLITTRRLHQLIFWTRDVSFV